MPRIARLFAAVIFVTSSAVAVYAAQSTVITLAASRNSVYEGTAVMLTATVTSNGAHVTPGQVLFCNAAVPRCEDQAVLGLAQLTANGTAGIKLVLAPGRHDIYAVFKGTTTYSGSSTMPTVQTVDVSGKAHTFATISAAGSAGDYFLQTNLTAFGPVAPTGTISYLDAFDNHTIAAVPLNPTSALQLSPATSYPMPAPPPNTQYQLPEAIAVGDVNGDGVLDLLTARDSIPFSISDPSTPELFVYFGDPVHPGQLLPPISYLLGAAGDIPTSAALGDFNSDGLPDLALTTLTSVNILLNDPAHPGHFLPGVIYPLPFPFTPVSIAVADFNGDGIADLVAADNASSCEGAACPPDIPNKAGILLGDPAHPGQFQPAAIYSTASGQFGNTPDFVVAADFNHDGLPDVAVAQENGTTNSVSVLLNDPTHPGTLLSPVEYQVTTNSVLLSLAVGDFNADGLPDLVVSSVPPSRDVLPFRLSLNVFLSNSSNPGHLIQSGVYSMSATDAFGNPGSPAVTIGDFNADGVPDLAAVGNGLGLQISLGDSAHPGQFLPPDSYDEPASNRIVAGDFNNDGLSDVAVINQPGGNASGAAATVGVMLERFDQIVTATNVNPGNTSFFYGNYSGDSNYWGYQSCEISLTNSPASPKITGVTVSSITATSAAINWTTNVPAYGGVNYGTTLNFGSNTPWVNPVSTTHSFVLTNLAPGTTYNYQPWSVSYFSGCSHWTAFANTGTFTTAAQ